MAPTSMAKAPRPSRWLWMRPSSQPITRSAWALSGISTPRSRSIAVT
jgi:hypothetical protein